MNNNWTISNFEARLISKSARRINDRIAKIQKQNIELPNVLETAIERYSTATGRFKKGTKMIKEMSKEEFETYNAMLKSADVITSDISLYLDMNTTISTNKDLWKAMDVARMMGTPPDSDDVYDIVERFDGDTRDLADIFTDIVQVGKGVTGVAEFSESKYKWFDEI